MHNSNNNTMKKLMQNKKIWLPLIIAAALYLIVVFFVLPRRQEQDEELVNKTKLILITPTYDRITQRADMIRVSNTFKHLENILWIVVEDSATKSFHLTQFLKQTGIEHVHLNAQNTEPNPNKHRGVAQRNAALDYIRANPNLCNAVVYFADDDNSYDLRLFKEMRKVTTVGVFYVGLINQAYMGAEGPSVKIGEGGKPKVVGWLGRAVATRTYRIDMAGFAFSARYVCSNPRVRFENSMTKWFLEDLFLARIGVPVSELQVFTDKVLAFHTKTVIPNVGPYTRDWVIPFGANTSPVPTTETQAPSPSPAPSQAPAPSVTGKTQLTMTGAELEKKFNQVGVIIENMQALGQYSTGVCKFRLGEVRTLKHSADLMGNECEPWMSRYSVEYLERFVTPTMRILEWGSGTSSFWWLTRAGHLTSIEHYPKWYKTVKEQIEQFPPQIARKWRGVPVKVEGVETLKRGDDYQTDLDYSEYYSAKMLPNDEKFDIILVDGRRRIQCFKRAMQLIQPHGGVIVLDNSKRERYREIFEMAPPQWTMKQFGSGDEETTMWLTRP